MRTNDEIRSELVQRAEGDGFLTREQRREIEETLWTLHEAGRIHEAVDLDAAVLAWAIVESVLRRPAARGRP